MKLLDFIFFVIVVGLALTVASIVSAETLAIPVLQKNPLRGIEIEKAVLFWGPFINFIRTLVQITLPALVGVWIVRYAEYRICKKPAPIETRFVQIWFLLMMSVAYFPKLSQISALAVYGTIIVCAVYVMSFQFRRVPLRDDDMW